MSETIAITGKSVKLFKGHYTSNLIFSSRAVRQLFADQSNNSPKLLHSFYTVLA
ncbi:MAG: hypothetical protein ACREYE_08555 [Gammaproteobacteria bacterium]